MQNRPKLRFKEFNYEWSNTTLGDVCAIYDGTHQTPDYKESGVQFLSVENIKDIDASNKFISEEDFRRDFKIKPEVNDILMTRIGDIGTPALVKTNKDYAYYVSLALLKCKNDILPSYLLQAIVEDNFQRQLWKNTLHVAFPKKINKGDIGKCKIKHPSLPEQQKIAEFLSKVDEVIAEREAEVKDLEQKKKGLMQKLFSQQLRFTDSNNQPYPEWKEKQIGKICKTFSGGTPSVTCEKYYNGDIPFIKSGEIHSENTEVFITKEGLDNSSAKLVEKGDLLFALYGATSGEVDISRIDGAINQAILCIRSDEINLTYLKNILNFNKDKILCKYLQGGQGNLSAEIVKSLTFIFPTPDEQEKIANVLSKLDELIEEKKALLSDWQQFKKGLLQQMFV